MVRRKPKENTWLGPRCKLVGSGGTKIWVAKTTKNSEMIKWELYDTKLRWEFCFEWLWKVEY